MQGWRCGYVLPCSKWTGCIDLFTEGGGWRVDAVWWCLYTRVYMKTKVVVPCSVPPSFWVSLTDKLSAATCTAYGANTHTIMIHMVSHRTIYSTIWYECIHSSRVVRNLHCDSEELRSRSSFLPWVIWCESKELRSRVLFLTWIIWCMNHVWNCGCCQSRWTLWSCRFYVPEYVLSWTKYSYLCMPAVHAESEPTSTIPVALGTMWQLLWHPWLVQSINHSTHQSSHQSSHQSTHQLSHPSIKPSFRRRAHMVHSTHCRNGIHACSAWVLLGVAHVWGANYLEIMNSKEQIYNGVVNFQCCFYAWQHQRWLDGMDCDLAALQPPWHGMGVVPRWTRALVIRMNLNLGSIVHAWGLRSLWLFEHLALQIALILCSASSFYWLWGA